MDRASRSGKDKEYHQRDGIGEEIPQHESSGSGKPRYHGQHHCSPQAAGFDGFLEGFVKEFIECFDDITNHYNTVLPFS